MQTDRRLRSPTALRTKAADAPRSCIRGSQPQRLNNIDPEAWLADVIACIADHPISKLDDLLPWKWEKAPKAIAA